MSTIYIHCTCGHKFVVEALGDTIITCPRCGTKYRRFFDARSGLYVFETEEKGSRSQGDRR